MDTTHIPSIRLVTRNCNLLGSFFAQSVLNAFGHERSNVVSEVLCIFRFSYGWKNGGWNVHVGVATAKTVGKTSVASMTTSLCAVVSRMLIGETINSVGRNTSGSW